MTILEMSLGGGVLIAVILVLRRALLYRVPKWTFLLLWAAALCRLIVPFAIPSPVSVYTGAAWITQVLREEEVPPDQSADAPLPLFPVTAPGTFREDSPVFSPVPQVPEPEKEPLSPLAAVWLAGTALCGLFFACAYLRALRRFWDAAPAEDPLIRRWQEEHPALPPIRIRVSRAVNVPLACGLLRPVILLPDSTDWSDQDQLTYVLTHEYIHIRRRDLLWKLLLAAALCVHWFNPLVWAMYFRANQDLELACDEMVVRTLGLDSRKRYARALLSAAENGFFPLCTTYAAKSHMEERIRAIMKIRKQSLAAVLAALLLVAGITAVFATSRVPAELDSLPQAVQGDPPPVSEPAPADTSASGSRAHPITGQPADTSQEPAGTPADTSDPAGSRVSPITGQSAGTSQEPAAGKTAPEPETSPAYPVNSKGQTYGLSSIVSPEDHIPDLINVPFIQDGEIDSSVVCYVRREDAAPYRYPGETNNPDDAMDYMAWLGEQSYSVTLPAYDREGDSLGTTEVILNDGVKIDTGGKDLDTVREEVKLNRWGVPYGEIPEGTEITVSDGDELNDLCDYLRDVRGIENADIAVTRRGDGTCTVCVACGSYETDLSDSEAFSGDKLE